MTHSKNTIQSLNVSWNVLSTCASLSIENYSVGFTFPKNPMGIEWTTEGDITRDVSGSLKNPSGDPEKN